MIKSYGYNLYSTEIWDYVLVTNSPVKSIDGQPLLLDVSDSRLIVTSEQFDRLCINNHDLRLELTKYGELIVMPPTGGKSGKRNVNLATDVTIWN